MSKPITDLDRDRFLKASYEAILEYFKAGIVAMNCSGDHMAAELMEDSSSKLSCQVYVNGSKKAACRIWFENGRHGHIYFSETPESFGNTKSYNESISIDETGGALKLKGLMGSSFGLHIETTNASEAAETLGLDL